MTCTVCVAANEIKAQGITLAFSIEVPPRDASSLF